MAASTTTVTDIADAAERQKRLELKALLEKKYKWIDRKWDIVFWVTAVFVVAVHAAAKVVCFRDFYRCGRRANTAGSIIVSPIPAMVRLCL